MKDIIFYHEKDVPSQKFMRVFQNSGLENYVSMVLFHVDHPSNLSATTLELLDLLEVDRVPTLYHNGQRFSGAEAFEWVEFQVSHLTGSGPSQGVTRPPMSQAPMTPGSMPPMPPMPHMPHMPTASSLQAHDEPDDGCAFDQMPSSLSEGAGVADLTRNDERIVDEHRLVQDYSERRDSGLKEPPMPPKNVASNLFMVKPQ